MKTKRILLLLLISILNLPLRGQRFDIYTENWPPYNYIENDQVVGISVDIVREILKKVGHPDTIQLVPWARAYHEIQKQDNVIVFSMGYSEDRKDLFKWVGPIAEIQVSFYKRKGSAIRITTLDDARSFEKIGVARSTLSHSILKNKGFSNMEFSNTGESLLKKLISGRCEVIVSTSTIFHPQALKLFGIEKDEIVKEFEICNRELYIAFSKNTPDSVIRKWQKILEDLKKSKKYEQIFLKYL